MAFHPLENPAVYWIDKDDVQAGDELVACAVDQLTAGHQRAHN
ncbi:hypothetical protein OAV07_01245 [Acidimicrobiales bacterium]|nr:hypothetical protein [Acidimicrobiales bacterium]MDC3300127.1 hypothetical protein [Acidimicrobiales bacterium]